MKKILITMLIALPCLIYSVCLIAQIIIIAAIVLVWNLVWYLWVIVERVCSALEELIYKFLNRVKRTYYKSGKLKEEIEVTNGELHGTWKNMKNILIGVIIFMAYLITVNWFMSIMSQGEHDFGVIITSHHTTGELECETPLVNDKKHGIEKCYYKGGQLESERPYVNGGKHGIVKKYYGNGQLMCETPWVKDEVHGIEKEYYETGKPKEEIQWNHYKIIGRNYYDENGNIIIK
jgi:hypothetical protein